jgi:phenylacetic acid degradation operon negative regulatory protein
MEAPVTLHGPLARLADSLELRANSLIITLFGDAVVPRGGNIWLGSLIALLAPFGISERLVRTGVYRLAREGWLEAQSSGRRAYYTLTASGRKTFAAADRRIYATEPPAWDGTWRLVQLLPGVPQHARQALRRELHWLGFGQLSPTMLAHPTADMEAVHAVLADLALDREALVFSADLAGFVAPETVGAAASAAWELDALNEEYGRFRKAFAAFCERADGLPELNEPECFALRILMIHDYRRILLKDPMLPRDLLPGAWSGDSARQVAARTYKAIAGRADAHLARIRPALRRPVGHNLSRADRTREGYPSRKQCGPTAGLRDGAGRRSGAGPRQGLASATFLTAQLPALAFGVLAQPAQL